MKTWQLQEAKAHLSELVKDAIIQGPQEITLRGEPAAVVISRAEYDQLTQPGHNFVEFMQQSPLVGIELNLKRDTTQTRKVRL